MDFNLHCPCFHKGSLVTVPGVPWFKDPALRSQETSLQSSNGREAESNDVTRGESAGGLPTSLARFTERSESRHSRSSGCKGARRPSDSARRRRGPGDPPRSETAGARLAGPRPEPLGSPRPHRPLTPPPDRPAGAPAAAARGTEPTPHASRSRPQPLRGYGSEPETPHAGPQEAPGPLGSRPLSGGPNRHRRRRTYQGRESGREHLTSLTLFRERTSTLELEGTASPHPPVRPATAHAHADPAPTRAREPARGARWEREFSRRCRRGRGGGGGGVRSPTRGTLTCRHLSLPQSRLRPLRTLPRPSHSIPAVARARKRGVSSDCSLFHTPRSQSSDPACSTGKYVQNPTTSHANTRPAGAPPPSLPGLLKESAKGPLVPTPARHLSATYRRSGQLDPIERERESSVRTEAVRDLKTLSCWLGRCRKGPQDKKCLFHSSFRRDSDCSLLYAQNLIIQCLAHIRCLINTC
ncbi:serine/arginine repetitive matrix protein 1-like [Sagmatias obliquidens]|uniref:serine/arginine repetitive matrix protein 1-like n=1 Tax=Sagmatias obliquidens TaxID=3371155 RepID=UPI000F441A78|nr:serine/arginine repetitive matrix protein 1-like [Lagenorhynchus obliquidens]